MIFDETSYSPVWEAHFPLSPAQPCAPEVGLPRFLTHTALGGIKPAHGSWTFEPGLGADVEISHLLLLHCGFRLVFANEQSFELILTEPGVFVGRLPARAKPELFSLSQKIETREGISFLEEESLQIGLKIQTRGPEKWIALCVQPGTREACEQKLDALCAQLPELLDRQWNNLRALREEWTAGIPAMHAPENTGLAIERLRGLLQAPTGIFQGPWIQDPGEDQPVFSLKQLVTVLPAFALLKFAETASLIQTLLELPRIDGDFWAEKYTPEGPLTPEELALPVLGTMLASLPAELLRSLDLPELSDACLKHLQGFLNQPPSLPLPQWPQSEAAFIPEVTDQESLIQFDLAALLVIELEALKKLRPTSALPEETLSTLIREINTGFWSEKRKRYLDKTREGEFASRVTAASLLPLCWNRCGKRESAALRHCLRNSEELCSPLGIRQWQPKKDDPVSPPVSLFTQTLFLPLLDKLPAETASLLSADWHRCLQKDPGFTDPGTAALQLRMIPYADRINPHLEKYPAWVRRLEKHRQTLVTMAAVILLLIPAGFSIYFAMRTDYNLNDELLEAGAAETLITIGNLGKAEQVYTRLLEKSRFENRKTFYYLRRGNLRFKQEKYEEAFEDYQHAIELDSPGNFYKARWNLAQTCARLGRKQEAIGLLQAFIDEYGEELPLYADRAENAMQLWK